MRFRDGHVEGGSPLTDFPYAAIEALDSFCRAHPDGCVWTWLNIVSDMSVAAAFGKLFWPDLLEREGGIFLRERFTESGYQEWKRKFHDDIGAIERMMNHVHLYDLFMNPKFKKPGAEAVCYLAGVMARLWSLRAADQFGAGRVVVDLVDEDPPGTDPVIVLHQAADGKED